jgi:arylsulfatase A-like enzyme
MAKIIQILCCSLGLPADIPTIPSLLNCLGGYETAMAGKWHLGHVQHRMTPIGKGFDEFTGTKDVFL